MRTASVPAPGKAAAAFGQQLPESIAAHHNMRDRLSLGVGMAVGRRHADKVHEVVFDDETDLVDEQRRLRHKAFPCSRQVGVLAIHHEELQPGINEFASCTAFQRNGFRAVSLPASADTTAFRKQTSKYLGRHGYTALQSRLMLLSADRRKFGPKKKPNNILLDDLNSKPCHEKTGERFGLGKLRQFAVAVGLHFQFLTTLLSRAVSPVPRDGRRPCAGMVGPSLWQPGLVAHRSSPSGSLLLSPHSVAGNGDSNGPFGTLRNVFGVLRILFGAPEPRWSSHV